MFQSCDNTLIKVSAKTFTAISYTSVISFQLYGVGNFLSYAFSNSLFFIHIFTSPNALI
jgi:hypothetical protein